MNMQKQLLITGFLLLGLGLTACDKSEDSNNSTTFRTDLGLPESLTGPKITGLSKTSDKTLARGVESIGTTTTHADGERLFQCRYAGPEDDDIFRNGYNMTKFMTSAVATWTCIGDSLIYISSVMSHDGEVHETKHDGAAEDYDPTEPTHYKISDGDNGKVEVALYYGYSHSEDLPNDAVPGFYLAWREQGESTQGRMIIDTVQINNPDRDPEDPVKMRMDFDYDDTGKKADMYMVFDENNIWADGFRIQVTKDLTAADDTRVFTAIGKMDMVQQFAPAAGITEIPVFDVFTISDAAGSGAAHAELMDLSIPLPLGEGKHLGNYLADKSDIYYFDEHSNWDWIKKSFSNSVLRGTDRNLTVDELDAVEFLLGISSAYFDTECLYVDDNCDVLINAVYESGNYNQEENQGNDPEDWRSIAMGSQTHLDSVFPAGADNWENVFVLEF